MSNKFYAHKVEIDGYIFDSRAEGARYLELALMEKAGVIQELTVHPAYVLEPRATVNGHKLRAITYVADFSYLEDGQRVVEDCKGYATPVFRLKENLFRRRHPDLDFRVILA